MHNNYTVDMYQECLAYIIIHNTMILYNIGSILG